MSAGSQVKGVPGEGVPGRGIPMQRPGGEKADGLLASRRLFRCRGHSSVFKGTDFKVDSMFDCFCGLSSWFLRFLLGSEGENNNNYLVDYCEISVNQQKRCVWHAGHAFVCCFSHCSYLVWLKVWGWEDGETEAGEVNRDLLVWLKNLKMVTEQRGRTLLWGAPPGGSWNVVCSK